MPSSAEILETLFSMAHDLVWLAVVWHAVMLAAAGAWIIGLRPSSRAAMLWPSLPSLSVSVAAFAYQLPFNGVAFGVLGVAFVALGLGKKRLPLQPGPTWAVVLGTALLLFGWFYPHFNTEPWYRTLYAAPTGVVPCPTLAVLAGVVLIGGGLRSRAASSLLAAWCALYATFGMFRLGVVIDVGLLAGALGLLVLATRHHPRYHGQLEMSPGAG